MRHNANLQVGFRDMVGFGVGVALPTLLATTALIVALAVAAGPGAGPGISIGMMAGIVSAMALEVFRRVVVGSRGSGRDSAVRVFRCLVWIVLIGTPLVGCFVAAGVFSGCYGHGCDALSRAVMIAMLVLSGAALPMLPLGWRLLRRAVWLQPG